MNSKDRIEAILPRLEQWKARHAKLAAQVATLTALTGAETDSPLLSSVWGVWDAYTKAITVKSLRHLARVITY